MYCLRNRGDSCPAGALEQTNQRVNVLALGCICVPVVWSYVQVCGYASVQGLFGAWMCFSFLCRSNPMSDVFSARYCVTFLQGTTVCLYFTLHGILSHMCPRFVYNCCALTFCREVFRGGVHSNEE